MKIVFGLLAAATAFVASPSLAATCQFTMAGAATNTTAPYNSPLLASFQLDCSPTPSNSTGSRFDVDNVAGLYNGPGVAGNNAMGTGPITAGDLQFYIAASGGGFGVNYPQGDPANGGFGLFSLEGAQLFGGGTATPTFLPGVYTFTHDYFYGDAVATLTITQLAAGVPEPTTWAMLLAGFAGVGMALRRRQRAAPAALTA